MLYVLILGNRNLLQCDALWRKLVCHYESYDCIKTLDNFPPKHVKKSRRQMMDEHADRIYRKYGESIYERGQATSYEGSFDVKEDDRRGRRRRQIHTDRTS